MKFIGLWILLFCVVYHSFGKDQSFPILVLADDENFGTYTGEILKAEGFNEFKIESLSTKHNLSELKDFNIVILAEKKLTKFQIDLFQEYVRNGGNLIAFRPDEGIAPLFGIKSSGSTIAEGYIKIDTSNIGRGLTAETIQYHGESGLYKLVEAEKIAGLYSDSKKSTDYPSVVINHKGKGLAAAFTYNLPKSIVYTRQGNPLWAGEERDKVDGPTSTDLFYPLQGQTQWNDPSKIAIPQADEQMRLLTHIIGYMSLNKMPLPRFWYFPDLYKSIFIFTIDGEESKETDIDKEIQEVQSKGGNATLYEIGTYIKPETVQRWRSSGNETAIHYNDVPNYASPTFANMKTVLDTMTSNFTKKYGYNPQTTRNHWVVWASKDSAGQREFSEQAALEARYGIGLDCNYYQFGGNKVYPNWIGDVGHFTGSGIPMKFSSSKGKILPVYQSNTQLPDETWLKENIENKSKTLISSSLDQENYAWINANYHTWYWPETREAGLRVLDYCNERGVPIWTAQKAYDFLKMKDDARFEHLRWENNILSFEVKSTESHSNMLTILIPNDFNELKINQIFAGNKKMSYQVRRMKGQEYALISVRPGILSHLKVSYN